MAEKLKPFHLLCMFSFFLFVLLSSVNVSADEVEYQRALPLEEKTTRVWLTKVRQSGKDYWAKLRETLVHGHSHFFPPNIDFSGKESDDVPLGPGEKVKEAAKKSFEKSKEVVEETAKSAAHDVAEAVKEKVKGSVSGGGTEQRTAVEL